jgi:nitric oxide reductase subunit C
MTQSFTKENARNIFYGGTVFFLLLFLNLTFSTSVLLPKRDRREQLNPSTNLGQQIAAGKALWEKYDCIGCHSLLGEGAYFAPELGNVYQRYNQNGDGIKRFIRSRPVTGVILRRSMPQFSFTVGELDALVEFLKYSSQINTSRWPPNKEG